jgi:hypothetical protein
MNRETKAHDRLTGYVRDLMDKVAALETAHEQPQYNRLPVIQAPAESSQEHPFARARRCVHHKTRTAA